MEQSIQEVDYNEIFQNLAPYLVVEIFKYLDLKTLREISKQKIGVRIFENYFDSLTKYI